MRKLAELLSTGRYRYVLVNTLVSLVAFGRNVLFMKTLGLADLGQVALMQTIVLLVGFTQAGTVNGAYILFAEGKVEQTQRILAVLSAGLVALVMLAGVATLVGAGRLMAPLVSPETLILGVFGGLCTIASTWMNNLLIAKGHLARSNFINVAAVGVSLVLAVLSLPYGLPAALASMLLQPLAVAIGALALEPDVRPVSLRPDFETLKLLLGLGAMPFLGSLFTLMTYQIERWSIVFLLGQEALGQFYLVIMYMTFFTLIPASLLNVHFPRGMTALRGGEAEKFHRIRRRHFAELVIYGAAALVLTVTVLPIAVRATLPQFEPSITLTFLALPVLFLFTLRDSAALVLYSVKKTKPILVSGFILVAAESILLIAAATVGAFSLSSVIVLRGAAVIISTAYLFKARAKALREIL